MVAVVGFKQTSIQFERPARYSGKGNYNRFLGSLRIGMNGLICFSDSLLRISTLTGFMVIGAALILTLIRIFTFFAGISLPFGNPLLVTLILFMGGVQLISVGILGEYIGRIYDEVKQRPKFIVDQAIGFGELPAVTKST